MALTVRLSRHTSTTFDVGCVKLVTAFAVFNIIVIVIVKMTMIVVIIIT